MNNTSKYGLTGTWRDGKQPGPARASALKADFWTAFSFSSTGSIFANDRSVIDTALKQLRDSAGNIYVCRATGPMCHGTAPCSSS